ncbi:Mercuric resistance operon regulatory protein [Pandoraea iniqua]|uniref:Mercuric resistance operon regulatory protein n=1 Tax=Pandoraea iniqua TaxID=2508288 RepID=A0A5E4VPL4_9BURK|nr:MerR family transcriptional regulator [Pandoraea iniqua]VVE13893.1 Mercuric resistance operon regulatory protein [Pandoraea iniqua]
MVSSDRNLTASEAAQQLGVSGKALRLYEQHGLLAPGRTAAGYRQYGTNDMARAGEIVALRKLGLSVAQVKAVLGGDAQALAGALELHEKMLLRDMAARAQQIARVRELRAELRDGRMPAAGALAQLLRDQRHDAPGRVPLDVGFALPWPWGGEWFELKDLPAITFLTGPLGSGKTRLAMQFAESIPGASFVGLDRVAPEGALALAQASADEAARVARVARVERATAWILEEGGEAGADLRALLMALDVDEANEKHISTVGIVDMVEQGLNQATQEALIRFLRHRAGMSSQRLILMTRSVHILDLSAVGPNELLILCPANHAPPFSVAPYPGARGYEALASCLAPVDVRARTQGMISWRPPAV